MPGRVERRRTAASRLAATQAAVDDAERREALRALMMQPLLSAAGDTAEPFLLVRRHAEWLSAWLLRWPGWKLVLRPDVARLQKIPSRRADATRGVIDKGPGGERNPFSRRRYATLCLVLAALETEQRQTTLRQVAHKTELSVRADADLAEIGFDFDLKVLDHRRDLVAVMRLLQRWNVLIRADGDDAQFVHADSDCLYRIDRPTLAGVLGSVRGASTVVIRHAGEPVDPAAAAAASADSPTAASSRIALADLIVALNDVDVPDTADAQNRALQHSLVRRLLDDPVMYFDELTQREYDYWIGQSERILQELHHATGLEIERRAEGVALLDLQGGWSDVGLPEAGTRGHTTLLLAEWLANRLRQRTTADVCVARAEIIQQMTVLAAEHARHWRQNVDTPDGVRQITDDALDALESLGLVEASGDGVRPRPAIARYRVEENEA